jgi:hypothetical protein
MTNPIQNPNVALPIEIDLPINVTKAQVTTTIDLTVPCFVTPESPLDGPLPTGAGRVRYYDTLNGAVTDWGTEGEVYKAATAWASQSPRTETLAVAQIFTTPQAGYLVTGIVGSLASFLLVSNGSFRVSIDGVASNITGLDFTEETDYDDVAAVIQTAIRAVGTGGYSTATVTASASTGTDVQFTITSGSSGDGSSVSQLSTATASVGTNISGSNYLNGVTGTSVLGYTPTGIANELTLVTEAASCSGRFVYGLVLDATLRDTEDQLDAAQWAEGQMFNVLSLVTDNVLTTDSGNTSNNAYSLHQDDYAKTFITYSYNTEDATYYEDMSSLTYMLSVDYNAENSTATLKFKNLPGIPTTSVSETELSVLNSRRCNVFTTVGNGARTMREGVMCSNSWFVDDRINIDNFLNDLLTAVYNVFLTTKKVPFTAAGQALLYNAEQGVCNKYVRNGAFADSTVVDATSPTGIRTVPAYVIEFAPLSAISQSDRAERLMTGNVITVQLAGAVHKLQINVVVEG